MSWLWVKFIGVSTLWILFHVFGIPAYKKHIKEMKKNDGIRK